MLLHTKTKFADLGLLSYAESWDYQNQLFDILLQARLNHSYPQAFNHLLFVEHPHVYTLGRNGDANNLLINAEFLQKIEATYYKTDRGGDITYHGPGQLVGYPILNLEAFAKGIKDYIDKLEQAVIDALKHYHIEAGRLKGATGVWLDADTEHARKICAIGVRTSRGISMHGFAFNVNTNLDYFRYINPCGFVDKSVTSMRKELGSPIDINGVKTVLKQELANVFQMEFVSE
jgi:lipoyl(octanoyl) transferase